MQCVRAFAEAGPELPSHQADGRLDEGNRSRNQGHQLPVDFHGVPYSTYCFGDLTGLRYTGALPVWSTCLPSLNESDIPIRLAVRPHHRRNHDLILSLHHFDHFVADKVQEASQCCRQPRSHCCSRLDDQLRGCEGNTIHTILHRTS